MSLYDILDKNSHEQEESDLLVQLPQHFRCASHTLDLIAKDDVEKMVQNSPSNFKKLYRKAMGKCSSLWSKQNMSNRVAEKIHNTLDVYLRTPNKTRWNCIYDSLLQIKNIFSDSNGHNKMSNIMDFCEIQRFTNQEIQLIQEYCEVMTPLAHSLDFLQGEESMFMGYLLPTLYALDKKLTTLKQKNMNFCSPLVNAVKSSVQTRFSAIWEKKELILASCLLPRFKLLWLDGVKRFSAEASLKSLFESVDHRSSSGPCEMESSRTTTGEFKEDFFCLPVESNRVTSSGIEELELYLKSQSRELSLLLLYPSVLKAFLELNTPLPSSAPVERLFSTGSNVITEKRYKLGDLLFEKLVLLKQNKVEV
ncbi:zinc finger BED domain-containing protein 4-like [Hydra vulgaris]|uniref:zinc finger BED domain-containing protein 4-like n=1 Tax=Hydra vulgaris TaxID=6087 RepID=UPI001F5E73B2|nr:zinc finger BED domain-containing protein 4-like [Hydra vulgaris]